MKPVSLARIGSAYPHGGGDAGQDGPHKRERSSTTVSDWQRPARRKIPLVIHLTQLVRSPPLKPFKVVALMI